MMKFIGISLILAVIQLSESSPVYQFLPKRDGYIPVYIRLGDTPLDEINPDLALAFHESSIATRNANDLEEQMQNDAPNVDDLSESEEDINEKITISKGPISEEEENDEDDDDDKPVPPKKPQAPVTDSVDEPDSVEKIEAPQKDSPVPSGNKSDEDVDSVEETDLAHLTKDDDSEEIGESSATTNKSSPDDSGDSVEVTKSRRNVTVPPPPPKSTIEDGSSEEVDDVVPEKEKPSPSYENKSSEEAENKS